MSFTNLISDLIHSQSWPAVLDERAKLKDKPAVYALMHQYPFGRLRGESPRMRYKIRKKGCVSMGDE
ncbi:hypothetical protein BN2476_380018 [Paraburkholderia piptadeniae]|uniref:Uncharacterized protein n=1 Tax=Paraburkholderia piptadeniae TaxID=1701573 RepID=A0A1N7S9M4_9BURK|nr:hypothetical protein BN2476_380018 [Paraburkholderia piptadeniae]